MASSTDLAIQSLSGLSLLDSTVEDGGILAVAAALDSTIGDAWGILAPWEVVADALEGF